MIRSSDLAFELEKPTLMLTSSPSEKTVLGRSTLVLKSNFGSSPIKGMHVFARYKYAPVQILPPTELTPNSFLPPSRKRLGLPPKAIEGDLSRLVLLKEDPSM